jgi:hypothetical protein
LQTHREILAVILKDRALEEFQRLLSLTGIDQQQCPVPHVVTCQTTGPPAFKRLFHERSTGNTCIASCHLLVSILMTETAAQCASAHTYYS